MTEFIAEVGGNHQGDASKLLSLTESAISAGVTIIKFQIYDNKSMVSKRFDPERYNHFKSFTLADDAYNEAYELCVNNNVEFMASIWSQELLVKFDPFVNRYKIGSGDLTNYPLIEKMTKRGKPIIISTGLSEIDEIDKVVEFVRSKNKVYKKTDFLTIMQCTSVYPCPLEEVNLNVTQSYRERYKSLVGYSHHTVQYSPIYTAISMGVDLIEFHYSDTKHDNSFRDHLISVDRNEVSKIIAFSEESRIIRGNDNKSVTKNEILNSHVKSFRRSLYYKRSLKKGHLITKEDFQSLRPCVGISPSKYEEVIGMRIKKDVQKDDVLLEEHLTK